MRKKQFISLNLKSKMYSINFADGKTPLLAIDNQDLKNKLSSILDYTDEEGRIPSFEVKEFILSRSDLRLLKSNVWKVLKVKYPELIDTIIELVKDQFSALIEYDEDSLVINPPEIEESAPKDPSPIVESYPVENIPIAKEILDKIFVPKEILRKED